MFKSLPTSPTQEMTNLQVSTQPPLPNDTSRGRTTRIEYIHGDNHQAMYIQRPMPEALYEVLTENDFENFCDTIDLILKREHESESLVKSRMCLLTFVLLSSLAIMFGTIIFILPPGDNVITPSSDPFVFYLFQYLFLIIAVCMIAKLLLMGKYCWESSFLRKLIHTECETLSNRIEMATFRIVMKEVRPPNSENSITVYSHIDVFISDAEQVHHNIV